MESLSMVVLLDIGFEPRRRKKWKKFASYPNDMIRAVGHSFGRRSWGQKVDGTKSVAGVAQVSILSPRSP